MYLIALSLVEDLPKEGTFYKEVTKGTGGVGKHPRMEIQFPWGDMESETTLLVSIERGKEAFFEELLSKSDALVQNTQHRAYFDVPDTDTKGTIVTTKKRGNLQSVIFIFAWYGFVAYALEKGTYRVVGIFPDKLSRAQMMWVRQYEVDPASVGPVRDGYRYRPHSFKDGWSSVYSFQGYAREIAKELVGNTMCDFPTADLILEKLKGITFPMRSYVVEQIQLSIGRANVRLTGSQQVTGQGPTHADAGGGSALGEIPDSAEKVWGAKLGQPESKKRKADAIDDDIDISTAGETTWATNIQGLLQRLTDVATALDALEVNKDVAPLTWEQMQQVNQITYATDYAPYSDEHKKRLKHLCLIYAIHGTVGRIAGSYEKSGKYRGLADDVRVFRGETSEQLEDAYENGDTSVLPATAINRLQKSNGKLKGTGGRGYKGIHKATRKPAKVYTPKWNMMKTEKVNEAATGEIQIRL
tara:strand:+ start:332 stop:1744 length:1413 start_codon:yes stop_codon:yes gene_type:complete